MSACSVYSAAHVAGDGARFLSIVGKLAARRLVVVPNWITELRARLAAAVKR